MAQLFRENLSLLLLLLLLTFILLLLQDMNEPSSFIQGSLNGCEDNQLNHPTYLPSEYASSIFLTYFSVLFLKTSFLLSWLPCLVFVQQHSEWMLSLLLVVRILDFLWDCGGWVRRSKRLQSKGIRGEQDVCQGKFDWYIEYVTGTGQSQLRCICK